VYACLSAHGASSEEIIEAQTYFQGICAAYIPGNPCLVTGASTFSVTSTQTIAIPVTTVEVFTTVVVPCTEATGVSAGSVIPSSSITTVISTSIVVPKVVFETITGLSTASAALVVETATTVVAGTIVSVAPAATATSKSNGTVTASSKPATFTGAGAQNSMAFSTFGFALLFAVFAL
jgi:hypothetical protein